MFFRFFSDFDWPEHLWAAVWAIELAIQALLIDMDEAPAWQAESATDLVSLLKQQIREYGFLPGIVAEGVSQEWTDEFLEREAHSLYAFVRQNREQPCESVAEFLKLNGDRLLYHLRRSEMFSARITERGRLARVELKKLEGEV